MSDLRSDLQNSSFVKSPADAVVNLHEQYVHYLGTVLDRHTPLISRLTKTILQIGCLMIMDMKRTNLRKLTKGQKIH